MTAIATLAASTDATARPAPPAEPLVLIAGRPRADLRVVEIDAVGPLDRRTATLAAIRHRPGIEPTERAAADRLRGARVSIVQPVALVDRSCRLIPLFDGRIVGTAQHASGSADDLLLHATDAWSAAVDRTLESPVLASSASLDAVAEAINAAGDLRLSTAPLPLATRNAAAATRLATGMTVDHALRSICESLGLFVQRSMAWAGHRVIERRTLRRIADGRPVRLAMAELANPAGAVSAIRAQTTRDLPLRFEAQADGQIVESTFTLAPGWGDGDEQLADGQYTRSGSDDFDSVAAVFRLWVLNEDGAPGWPPFDLTSLFAEGRPIEAQPLRFAGALTRDSGGRSVGVVVDTSLDSGDTWSRFAGRASVLTDRAGVYLDDDELPTAWLTAVRSGDARLRVTASLRSPLPLTTTRWIGNPFAGEFDPRVIRLGDAFAYRRVAPTSRFSADVAAGLRDADVVDDRHAMATWLAFRARDGAAIRGSAAIDVIGSTPALRVGDRIERLAGRAIGVDLPDPAIRRSLVTIDRITRRFDRHSTRLRCDIR